MRYRDALEVVVLPNSILDISVLEQCEILILVDVLNKRPCSPETIVLYNLSESILTVGRNEIVFL